MENENSGMTQAQHQIERLKQLKEQKDLSDKTKKDNEFRFAEFPHAVTEQPKTETFNLISQVPKNNTVIAVDSKSNTKTLSKKIQRASRLDRRNYDRIKKSVKKIKEDKNGMRLSEDMFINMILEKVLDLKIDFFQAKTSDEVRSILEKLKAE